MNEEDMLNIMQHQSEAIIVLETIIEEYGIDMDDLPAYINEMIEDFQRTCWIHQTKDRYCKACKGVGSALTDPENDHSTPDTP